MAGRIEGARWTTAVLVAAGILLGAAGIGISVFDARPSAPPITTSPPQPQPDWSGAAPDSPLSVTFDCDPQACLGLDLAEAANASVTGEDAVIVAEALISPDDRAEAIILWPAGTQPAGANFDRSAAEAALSARLTRLVELGLDPDFLADADPATLREPGRWSDDAFAAPPGFADDEDVSIEARAPVGYAPDYGSGSPEPPVTGSGAQPVTGSGAPPTRILGLLVSEFIGVRVILVALLAAGACGLWAVLTRNPDRRAMLNRYTTACVTFIGGAFSQSFGG